MPLNPAKSRCGFTLVEFLVSCTILVLVFLILTQIFANSSRIIREARSGNARVIIADSPAPYSVSSDAIAFVCSARPVNSLDPLQTRFSSVCYGLFLDNVPVLGPQATAVPVAFRGINRIRWADGAGGISSAAQAALQLAKGGGTGLDAFEPLSEGIFRMDVVYLLQDGSISPVAPVLSSGDFVPSPLSGMKALDMSRIKGLVVGIAVLERRLMRILLDSNTVSIKDLAESLPPVTVAGQTPLQLWSNITLPGQLPRPVRANVRFYEKTILIPKDTKT
jgi:hypothetical protein